MKNNLCPGRGSFILIWFAFFALSCVDKKEKAEKKSAERVVTVPSFNADSAYSFIRRQLVFGPRIPNTNAHRVTGEFIISTLKTYGAHTVVQEFKATTFDGQELSLRNIIASYNPKKQKRILLAAHWDTRPFADKDPVNPNAPFDGANDGASGVAALLEIARCLGQGPLPDTGVDLIFFDGEDWGERDASNSHIDPPNGWESWWCLGSQYWSKNKHSSNYHAYYGILLDMVGAENARFFQEGNSMVYAPRIVEKVWNVATGMGYAAVFINQQEDPIIDDHVFVNELANIPIIDITHFEPGVGYFGKIHHTQKDNLSSISKETLEIVGRVVMHVIYYEE